jgi:hypothetical protein
MNQHLGVNEMRVIFEDKNVVPAIIFRNTQTFDMTLRTTDRTMFMLNCGKSRNRKK